MLRRLRGTIFGRRRGGILALGIVLALAGAACVAAEPSVLPEPTATTVTATATATATPAATEQATPEATPEPTPYNGRLSMMRIPSLGVEAPIEAIGMIPGQNQLDVPLPRNVGWYDIYDKPGFGTSSLYSAHKDYYPNILGPFHKLTDLQAGDLVVVVMDDGREYVYEVFFQKRYVTGEVPMADLIAPHEAEDPALLRPADEEWAVLITCGGDFVELEEDGPGYYVHRDVLIARLVETRPPESVRGAE